MNAIASKIPRSVLGSLYFWLGVVAIDAAGLFALRYVPGNEALWAQGGKVYAQFIFLACFTTFLAAAPLIRFLYHGWQSRFDEFTNKLSNGAIIAYLKQFWEWRVRQSAFSIFDAPDMNKREYEAQKLFREIYNEQYGRSAFLIPFFLLILVIFAESVLVVLLNLEVTYLKFASARVATAAVAGAYMFVIDDIVFSVRRRSLNVSDVYWYALRMLLAVPMGSALGTVGVAVGSAVSANWFQAGVAFCICAFPVDALRKLMRRVVIRRITKAEKAEINQGSDLTKLEGVTIPIASVLNAEGVASVEQILGMDPILLAIRTGLPFKLILRLGSQAVVRRHLGKAAARLVPLGLADAMSQVALLRRIKAQDYTALLVLEDVATTLQDGADAKVPRIHAVLSIFCSVAADPYTRFLLADISIAVT